MSSSFLQAVAALAILLVQVVAVESNGTTWPALQFNFTLKRNTTNVHGLSEFSVYANPAVSKDGEHVLYDTLASFTERGTVYNYTMIDGAAYASQKPEGSSVTPTLECLDSDPGKLPPINAIAKALNEAVPVSSTNDSVTCSSEKLFKLVVNGIDFALCASGSNGFTMHGSDLDVDVQYIESIDIPTATTAGCTKVASSSSVSSIGKALLTGQAIPSDTRKLEAAFDFSFRDSATCSCKSTRRPCIFIHGLGVKQEVSGNEDWFSYWGESIKGHTPCCSSVQFAHLNTVNNTWTSKRQQEKVCDRALAVSNTSTDSVISDTIVVTHSMGNLMFAGALATGKCSLDSSSTWVGMAGPMVGSMASDFVQGSCAGETDAFWEDIGDITGRCPPNTGLKSLAYQGGNFSSNTLNAAYEAAQEAYRTNVSAIMCGRAYSGLVSKYQAKFWVLGHVIPHKSKKNDGMVEFQSCAPGIPESKFGETYRDRFYATKLNHYDMQFLAGDAILDEAKMPVKWFECLL